jgi:Spy/CpxP family protein refolding chaperone
LKREQDREKMMKETKEKHDKINEEFKSFLTPEQFQKLNVKQEEMRKKREEREKKHLPPPPAPEGK